MVCKLLISALGLLIILSIGCGEPGHNLSTEYGNAPSAGFNLEGSDASAISIADEVMHAMGGREAWDTSRYIGWTFFGRRSHLWDKVTMLNRIDIPGDSLSMIIDLNTKSGRVSKNGLEITNSDTLSTYLQKAYNMWINDSYWLVMPYKLKDSGVTLKSAGKDTTTLGAEADVLQLTFKDVGVTPGNKYLVYVDEESRLVTQWDFFTSTLDSLPRFQSPWPNYKQYGDLLLSGGQIAGNQLTDIKVTQSVDKNIFENL